MILLTHEPLVCKNASDQATTYADAAHADAHATDAANAANAADAACTAKWMFLWSCERTHFENCKVLKNIPNTTTFLVISTVQSSWDYVLRDGVEMSVKICMKIQLRMRQDIMKRKDGDTLLARPVILWS